MRIAIALSCTLVLASNCAANEERLSAEKLFDVVRQLEASRPLKRERIEQITHHTLIRDAVWHLMSDKTPGSEVTEIVAYSATVGGITRMTAVDLYVNPQLHLNVEAMERNFGKRPSVDRRALSFVPGNKKLIMYKYKRKWGYMDFEFEKTPTETVIRGISIIPISQ